MSKITGILVGLIVLLVPIYAWIVDFQGVGTAAESLFKGGVVWFLILVGSVYLLAGINNLKKN